MKRIVSVLTVFVLLSACVRAPSPPFCPIRDFRRAFVLTKGEFICGGTAACRSYDDVSLSFDYPEGLSYFNVSVGEGGMAAGVAGNTDTLFLEELPEDSALKLFVGALRRFVFTNVEFTRTAEGGYVCEETFAELSVRGVFSPEGEILRLECPGNGLLITFENEDVQNE